MNLSHGGVERIRWDAIMSGIGCIGMDVCYINILFSMIA